VSAPELLSRINPSHLERKRGRHCRRCREDHELTNIENILIGIFCRRVSPSPIGAFPSSFDVGLSRALRGREGGREGGRKRKKGDTCSAYLQCAASTVGAINSLARARGEMFLDHPVY